MENDGNNTFKKWKIFLSLKWTLLGFCFLQVFFFILFSSVLMCIRRENCLGNWMKDLSTRTTTYSNQIEWNWYFILVPLSRPVFGPSFSLSVDISSLRSKQSIKWIIFFLLFSYAYLTDDMILGLFFLPPSRQFSSFFFHFCSRTICRNIGKFVYWLRQM